MIHLYNEKASGQSDMPKYMKEKLKLNKTFHVGKQNYIVIAFSCENGKSISGFDLVVYDSKGKEIYRELLDAEFVNKSIGVIA